MVEKGISEAGGFQLEIRSWVEPSRQLGRLGGTELLLQLKQNAQQELNEEMYILHIFNIYIYI